MVAPVISSIDQNLFTIVQEQIEKDTLIRDSIREGLKKLDKSLKNITSILSRVHSVPASQVLELAGSANEHFRTAKEELAALVGVVGAYPYYKYNNLWQKSLQDFTFLVLLKHWLERSYAEEGQGNALLSVGEVGEFLGVPVNLKTEDAFHLTIEEYLHAVISLVEELSRLTTNAVTQRDFKRPMLISTFVKDVFAGFQVLNLKNDSLRRRSDGLKYNVKKVEDINYDLSVRNLLPTQESGEDVMKE